MKTLGVIGGAASLDSALFYQKIVEESYKQKGLAPELILINHPIVNNVCFKGIVRDDENSKVFENGFKHCCLWLRKNKIKYAVSVCNSYHVYLGAPYTKGLTFFHITEILIKEAVKKGYKNILVLGSRLTCQGGIYEHPSLMSTYPPEKEQHIVDNIINRVNIGQILAKDSRSLSRVINRLCKKYNCDAVVLGCTGLPVLHNKFPLETSVALLDSVLISARSIAARL